MELSGKYCLVTGASSGLGFEVTKRLAGLGANTTLLCRDRSRGESAIHDIKREIPNASVELAICDLASLASIQQFIEQFKEKHPKLDVLFNNAAVMKRKRTVTKDGIEMMFQVNYLAPFIFMNAFVGMMKNASQSQVINNTLPSYKLRIDMGDLQFSQKYNMYNSFFQTKLYLLFASLEFARRHKSDEISTIMAVPGTFKSNLVREIPLMGWIKNLFSAPVTQAAENILYVITLDHINDNNGKAFKERQEWPLSEYWKDAKIGQHLWSLTESLISNTRWNMVRK